MRIVTIGALVVPVLFSCSREYDGSSAAYDTARNPGGFPQLAVNLLQDIEAGTLATYDAIAGRFADLYTADPSLLGDPAWTEVIERLGRRLVYRADQLVRGGLPGYLTAAELYLVAAQTRPNDRDLGEQAALFSVWRETMADTTAELAEFAAGDPGHAGVPERIEFLRHFALSGERRFQFAEQYLRGALLEHRTLDSLASTEVVAGLPVAERAMRAALGFSPVPSDTPLARFQDPDIDLIAVRLTSMAMGSFRLEAYFLPRESVSADIGISCQFETPDTVLGATQQPRFPYDFRPVRPSSSWEPGRVEAGVQQVSFQYPVSAVLIGLHRVRNGLVETIPPADSSFLVRIPVAADSGGFTYRSR